MSGLEKALAAAKAEDRAALEVWTADRTHAHIRDYLRRTIGK